VRQPLSHFLLLIPALPVVFQVWSDEDTIIDGILFSPWCWWLLPWWWRAWKMRWQKSFLLSHETDNLRSLNTLGSLHYARLNKSMVATRATTNNTTRLFTRFMEVLTHAIDACTSFWRPSDAICCSWWRQLASKMKVRVAEKRCNFLYVLLYFWSIVSSMWQQCMMHPPHALHLLQSFVPFGP